MGKYLTNFKTKEEFNSFKDSSNYIYPNISYIEDSGSVINKSPQIQEKQVEITENGEITITPDAGFAYLNKVSVKTNVAQSGEGGGTASAWRYFDVSNSTVSMSQMLMPFIVKYVSGNNIQIMPSVLTFDWTKVSAFGVDDGAKLYNSNLGITSWSQIMANEGLTPEMMAQVGIVEITEEEFYNLNA